MKEFTKAGRLLSEHPELLRHTDASNRQLVHYAAASGHLEFIQNALSTRPELVLAEDDSGWTLLLIAASAGHPEVVRFLLTFPQTNVDHRNDTGQSALHYACSKDHMAIVLALINAGAELNPQDDRGATPLHRAACKGNQRIVNLLMGYRNRLQINLANREGDTPLHLACEDGHVNTAVFLVNCGADLRRANMKDETPLDVASGEQFKQKLIEASRSIGS